MSPVLTPSVTMQFILCTVGCVGFAMMFNVQGKKLVYCGIGALLDWTVYYLASLQFDSTFLPVFIASTAVAVYAQIMARVCKSPATVFLTPSIFPMIPGSHLYYMMYNSVMGMPDEAKSEGAVLLTICIAIATGFVVVAVFNKYTGMVLKHIKNNY